MTALLAFWVICYINLNIITYIEYDDTVWKMDEYNIHSIFFIVAVFFCCPVLLAWAIYEEYIEKEKEDDL